MQGGTSPLLDVCSWTLRESEARYRGVIESQQALIYRSDLDGKLTFIFPISGSPSPSARSPRGWRPTRITTRFPTAIPRLGEETEVAVYRVAQESLANAVRHAEARTVVLTIGTVDETLRLEVRDDGRGFDREGLRSRALGLAAMEARAVALGGSLRVRSTPGAGTTVCFECPLNAPEPERTG